MRTTPTRSLDISVVINELRMMSDIAQHSQILLKKGYTEGGELYPTDHWTAPMLLGVNILLQTYLVFNAHVLTSSQITSLEKMIGVIKNLENNSYSQWSDYTNTLQQAEFTKRKQQQIDKFKQILNKEGEVFIPGGWRSHHALYKIEKKFDSTTNSEVYFHTEFNAGGHSEPVAGPKSLVWGVNKKKVKGDVGAILDKAINNFHSANYQHLDAELLGETIQAESHQVAPQTVGNCTVRTTIEMLRAELDTSTFRSFFDFATKSNIQQLVRGNDVKIYHSERDTKTASTYNKIGEYTHFLELILKEAGNLLKSDIFEPSVEIFNQFESLIIERLMSKGKFSLLEYSLLTEPEIAKELAKDLIDEGVIKIKNNIIYLDKDRIQSKKLEKITADYAAIKKNNVIALVGEHLSFLLKKTISAKQLKAIEIHIFRGIDDSYTYMDYTNLLKLSFIIARGLIEEEFVVVEKDEIIKNTFLKPFLIKSISERNQSINRGLIHVTNASLGKDLCLSQEAKKIFNNITAFHSLKIEDKIQCHFLLKEILEANFPHFKITSEAVTIVSKDLLKIIKEKNITSLQNLIDNKENLILIIASDTNIRERTMHLSKAKEHIRFSLHRREPKIHPRLNKQISEIVDAINKEIPLSIKEKLILVSYLKNQLEPSHYPLLKYLTFSSSHYKDKLIRLIVDHLSKTTGDKCSDLAAITLPIKIMKDDARAFFLRSLIDDESKICDPIIAECKNLTTPLTINDYIEEPAKSNLIMHIIRTENILLLQKLIDFGINLEDLLDVGYTPLIYAYKNEKHKIIEFLEKLPNQNEHHRQMFIDLGKNKNYLYDLNEIKNIFINKGIDVNVRDKSGNTALIYAVYYKNYKIFNHLIELKANLDVKNSEGKTPLEHAYMNQDKAFIEVIIEAGADVSIALENMTPVNQVKFFGMLPKKIQENVSSKLTPKQHTNIFGQASEDKNESPIISDKSSPTAPLIDKFVSPLAEHKVDPPVIKALIFNGDLSNTHVLNQNSEKIPLVECWPMLNLEQQEAIFFKLHSKFPISARKFLLENLKDNSLLIIKLLKLKIFDFNAELLDLITKKPLEVCQKILAPHMLDDEVIKNQIINNKEIVLKIYEFALNNKDDKLLEFIVSSCRPEILLDLYFIAVKKGADEFKALLAIKLPDINKFEPLILQVIGGNSTNLVAALLDKSEIFKYLCSCATSPLLKIKDPNILKLFIKKQFPINTITSDYKDTLLINVINNKNKLLFDILIESKNIDVHQAVVVPINFILDSSNLKGQKDLINRFKGTSKEFVAGFTPLHMAILKDQDEMVTKLIERGADLDKKTVGTPSLSARELAVAMGNFPLLENAEPKLTTKTTSQLDKKSESHDEDKVNLINLLRKYVVECDNYLRLGQEYKNAWDPFLGRFKLKDKQDAAKILIEILEDQHRSLLSHQIKALKQGELFDIIRSVPAIQGLPTELQFIQKLKSENNRWQRFKAWVAEIFASSDIPVQKINTLKTEQKSEGQTPALTDSVTSRKDSHLRSPTIQSLIKQKSILPIESKATPLVKTKPLETKLAIAEPAVEQKTLSREDLIKFINVDDIENVKKILQCDPSLINSDVLDDYKIYIDAFNKDEDSQYGMLKLLLDHTPRDKLDLLSGFFKEEGICEINFKDLHDYMKVLQSPRLGR